MHVIARAIGSLTVPIGHAGCVFQQAAAFLIAPLCKRCLSVGQGIPSSLGSAQKIPFCDSKI